MFINLLAQIANRIVAYKRKRQFRQLIESGLCIVGQHSYGFPHIHSYAGDSNRVIIGNYCSIADNVHFFVGGNHPTHWITTYPLRIQFDLPGKMKDGHPMSKGDIIIGNDVWIGWGSIILSGVQIGDGAVVGAGSVVSKNVEPYTIVCGNPAQPIRKRFPDHVIDFLIDLKWWNWDKAKVIENTELLCSPQWDKILNKFRNK